MGARFCGTVVAGLFGLFRRSAQPPERDRSECKYRQKAGKKKPAAKNFVQWGAKILQFAEFALSLPQQNHPVDSSKG
jgi:hypothetical protein